MMSEVLPYLLMITCMLIRVSSKEVKWKVRDTSPKLGQGLTLFCKVDNCTVHETKRWHGGSDDRVLMLNSGISTDKAKYSTSIEKNGFILTILNLTVKDLNVSYACSCGFDLDKHILYIEDIYKVDNLNKSTNGNNYDGTNYANDIYLYVIIALSIVLLLFVVFVVVIIKSGSWKSLKEKFGGTPRTKPDADDNQNVTDPILETTDGDPGLGQSSDSSISITDEDLKRQRSPASSLSFTDIDIKRQRSPEEQRGSTATLCDESEDDSVHSSGSDLTINRRPLL